jgi:hypothetical protein
MELANPVNDARAMKDVLQKVGLYDEATNTTYLLEGFYTQQNDTRLKPARVISYMDDVLWMKSTGNIYWVFLKGEMISSRTTNYQAGNDLYITDTLTNVKYVLYDYSHTGENQFKPAFKLQ